VRRLAAVVAVVVLGSACAVEPNPPSTGPTGSPEAAFSPTQTLDDPRVAAASIAAVDAAAWQELAMRPVHLPPANPGACPIGSAKKISDGLGPALGDGPIYAVSFVGSPVMTLTGHERNPNGFYELKVLWVATDEYGGPALVRGGRIDGSGALEFDGGDDDNRLSMRSTVFSPDVPRSWRQFPSSTDVKGPGCYAWQVDGTTFSETIVFQVAP
jgi:hypothetical protein